MLFNRSKEAEMFMKAWGDAEKKCAKRIEEYKRAGMDEYFITDLTRGFGFYKNLVVTQREPLMFGIFKDTKKVKMADIKKVCIENNFKKKTFKTKQEAWSYLIKNF